MIAWRLPSTMASVFFRGSLIVAFLLRLFFWKFCSTFHKASHRPPNSKIAPCQLDCFKPSAFEKFRQGQARRKVILSPSRYIRPPQPPPLPRRKGRRKRCGCWKAHSTDVVDKIGNTWGLGDILKLIPREETRMGAVTSRESALPRNSATTMKLCQG